jgi:tripartite-type tricarboxylate transporter receptor subunit TctC
VHVVVPYGAGAVQDTLARTISVEFGQALGSTVVVENRAGAGGTIGAAAVARSPADGSTLILSAASHTIAGSLYAKLPYDPIRDFTAVAHMGRSGYVLMVNADVPARTAGEFVKWVKASPGKYNYASAGNGSATHLAMAYFAGRAGLDMVHIPLKSTGDAVTEVLSGRAQAVISASIGALPFQKDPRVRLLATTGAKRSKFLPDLPTVAESGLPGYEFDSWFGLLGPAGIPPAEVSRINLAMVKVLHDPVVIERLARLGVEPSTMTPEAFAKLLRDDFVKMAQVVKISGARVD